MGISWHFLSWQENHHALCVELKVCSIDDLSLGLLLEEFSRYNNPCLAGVLQGVTMLNISRNNIGDDGVAQLATTFLNQANTTMKILDISDNPSIAVNGAKALAGALSVNSSIEKLNISWTRIGDEGVALIANALQENTTMKELHVSDCGMSDMGAKSLGRALSGNSSLKKLNISCNRIGDEGVAHIADALHTNATMQVLDVSGCGMSDMGAKSLDRALSVNSSLEQLNISHTRIGDEGVAHIANALQTNTTMKVLDVTGCDMLCKGAKSLLTANGSLEKLYFDGSKFDDEGIAHIATANCGITLSSLVFHAATDKAALFIARLALIIRE